jgi:tetratricopeptide (TPR) repeat protein
MVFGDYDNFKTYDNMGYAYGELKEYQKAIDAYKEAIKIRYIFFIIFMVSSGDNILP